MRPVRIIIFSAVVLGILLARPVRGTAHGQPVRSHPHGPGDPLMRSVCRGSSWRCMGMALDVAPSCRCPCATPLPTLYLGIERRFAPVPPLGLLLGVLFLRNMSVPLTAFIGAALVSVLVGVFGWKRGGLWPERLLLCRDRPELPVQRGC